MQPNVKNDEPNPSPEASTSLVSVTKSLISRALFWSALYSLGLWKVHPGWLVLPITLRILWKRSKIKSLIQRPVHKVSDLPSWIYFPDCDRAEWINSILTQLWPALQEHIAGRLREMTANDGLLYGLTFSSTSIGNIPPRIEGVKVYKPNQVSRNEIVIDINIVLASDCYLKAGFWSWFGFAVRDLYLHGTLRITLCPLLKDLPLIGNIDVAFITPPNLDFDMEGVANILDVPGLSRIVRNVIIEQICSLMVLPNAIKTPLVTQKECEIMKYCPNEFKKLQLLHIRVIEANGLKGTDFVFMGKATADPYCVVKVASQIGKSQIKKETLNPKWDFTMEVLVDAAHVGFLELEIWDWDKGKSDDFMGRVVLALDQVYQSARGKPVSLSLEGRKPLGNICFETKWFHLSQNIADLEAHSTALSETAAVLQVYIDCCKNLVNKKGRAPKAKLTMKCGHDEVQESEVQDYSQNPEIEEEFDFLVSNPLTDKFTIQLEDTKYKTDLGIVRVALSELLSRPNYRLKSQPFRVEQTRSNAQIVMELQLQFLKPIPQYGS